MRSAASAMARHVCADKSIPGSLGDIGKPTQH
jgi:hypothetical protein